MIRPGILVAAAAALAIAAPAHAASVTPPSSQRFTFVDARQDFTVPAGVHQVHISAYGGGGGTGGDESGLYAAPGGLGAHLDLDAAVNPGDTLFINVGAQGGNAAGRSPGVGGHASQSSQNGGPGGLLTSNGSTQGTAGGGGGGGTSVFDSANSN